MKQINYLRISRTGDNNKWDYEVIGKYKRARCYNLDNKDLVWKLINSVKNEPDYINLIKKGLKNIKVPLQ